MDFLLNANWIIPVAKMSCTSAFYKRFEFCLWYMDDFNSLLSKYLEFQSSERPTEGITQFFFCSCHIVLKPFQTTSNAVCHKNIFCIQSV